MIATICRELNFPDEAVLSLSSDFEKMVAVPGAVQKLMVAMDDLFLAEGENYAAVVKEVAEQAGVHPYAADMVFALWCAHSLRYVYKQKGWSEELFWDAMADLRYKLKECIDIKGVWGSFVASWFRGFFIGDRHALGRLQYEPRELKYPYGEYWEGELVYNCHIPSSGPLTPELVLDSLKKAYDFYKPKDGILKVVCSTWMLYPPMYEVYPAGSNLRAFYELFTVLHYKESPENKNLWRIFGSETDLKKLPENSNLQRRLKAYLLEGNTMGSGYGILLFDGEKVLNKPCFFDKNGVKY